MNGTMIIIEPGRSARVKKIAGDPSSPAFLADLQKLVGGYIEPVPYFHSIEYPHKSGRIERCVVFVNEDGKRLQLLRNLLADELWNVALQRDFKVASCAPDFLVGTAVVVFGDREFMGAL